MERPQNLVPSTYERTTTNRTTTATTRSTTRLVSCPTPQAHVALNAPTLELFDYSRRTTWEPTVILSFQHEASSSRVGTSFGRSWHILREELAQSSGGVGTSFGRSWCILLCHSEELVLPSEPCFEGGVGAFRDHPVLTMWRRPQRHTYDEWESRVIGKEE